jgi:hypothetical protein
MYAVRWLGRVVCVQALGHSAQMHLDADAFEPCLAKTQHGNVKAPRARTRRVPTLVRSRNVRTSTVLGLTGRRTVET